MRSSTLVAFAAASLLAFSSTQALAKHHPAGPQNFEQPQGQMQTDKAQPRGPRGFDENDLTTVASILKNGRDNDKVWLRGRLTKFLGDEKYEFTDENGDTITVELDDKRDWSYLAKDMPIELTGKIDKEFMSIEIEVRHARPLDGRVGGPNMVNPKHRKDGKQ